MLITFPENFIGFLKKQIYLCGNIWFLFIVVFMNKIKGNAVKIGNSSRCCKLFFCVLNKHLHSHCFDKPEREGVQTRE